MTNLRTLLERAIQDALLHSAISYYPVIRQRFGLGTTVGRTLQELSGEAKCTRERVRQVEQLALRELPLGVPVDMSELAEAILRSNRTYVGATQAAARLLGDDIWLPGIDKLAKSFGQPLPAYGFGALARELGYDEKAAWQLIELRSTQKFTAKQVSRWMRSPEQKDFEDAPAYAVAALLSQDEPASVEELEIPEWLQGLSQPEQIRAVMLRTGFTRREMMDWMGVQRSTFDRWLWPASNPVAMPPGATKQLVKLAHLSGDAARPRKRRLGANKQHAVDGIPGCARRSRSRESGADLSLHRTKQSELYHQYAQPWVVVCETHRILIEVLSFADGLEAMAHPLSWCPHCAATPPADAPAESPRPASEHKKSRGRKSDPSKNGG